MNKHLYWLVGLLAIVSSLLGLIFAKYFPFLFRTPVYYCQHVLCSTLIKISSTTGTTLFKILVVTIIITLIKTAIDFIKIRSLRRSLVPIASTSKLNKISQELKISRQVVLVKHIEPFAFCLGFMRTKIVISDTLLKILSPEELKAVLHHEQYHSDHSDALTLYVTRFFQSLFPFFPLLGDQLKYLSLDREIKADKHAMSLSGSNQTLVSTLKKLLSYDIIPAYSTFPSFLGSEKNLEIRIKALMHQTVSYSPFSLKNITISFSALLILLGLLLLPLNTVNVKAANNTQEVVACLNDESCIQACQQETQGNDLLFHQLHPQK